MQKNFSEFVEAYKSRREAAGKSTELSPKKVAKLRSIYESMVAKKANKLDESKTSDEAEDKFEEALEQYREWKLENKGTRGVTSKEKENIREALKNGTVEKLTECDGACKEEKEEPKAEEAKAEEKDVEFEESIEGFKNVVTQYRKWKKDNHNTDKLTEDEKEVLKKKFLEAVSKKENTETEKLDESKTESTEQTEMTESKETVETPSNPRLDEAIKQYKEWKKKAHNTDEITKFEEATLAKNLVLDDIKAKLDEAKNFVESGKKHLTEGDVMDAGADATAAANAVNDATAMGSDPALAGDPNAVVDPNAGTALPQNIVDEISNIKTSIDSLATEVGIESPVDLGADPNAGVPAVTGAADAGADATVTDPNVQAPVADPNAQAPLPESMKSIKQRIAERDAKLKETIKYSNTPMKDGAKEDLVKIPSESELVNGNGNISSNVKKAEWPIKNVQPKDSKKLKNIEESTQEERAKMTLSEDGEFSWALYTKMLKQI